MEDAVFVHVINRLEHLIHEVLNSILWQVVPPALDRFVHIHVHQLKNQGESTGRFIAIIRQLKLFIQMAFSEKKKFPLRMIELTRALHGE